MEQTLIDRYAVGDPAAAAECLRRFGPLVWSLARRFSADDGSTDDLCAEIFAALRRRDRFEAQRISAETLVAIVAREVLSSHSRGGRCDSHRSPSFNAAARWSGATQFRSDWEQEEDLSGP